MRMKIRHCLMRSGSLAGLLLLPATFPAQDPSAHLLSAWLRPDSMDGDAGQLAMQLEQSGTAVEPALISAAQNGPDPDTLLEIQTAAESRFDALEPWIVPNGTQMGLSANDIQLVQEKARDQFVAETVQEFKVAYRSRPLVGLGIIA